MDTGPLPEQIDRGAKAPLSLGWRTALRRIPAHPFAWCQLLGCDCPQHDGCTGRPRRFAARRHRTFFFGMTQKVPEDSMIPASSPNFSKVTKVIEDDRASPGRYQHDFPATTTSRATANVAIAGGRPDVK